MRIGIIPVMLMLAVGVPAKAQTTDSVQVTVLNEFVVHSSFRDKTNLASTHRVEIADALFLREHFTGNLIQALANIPGVKSMDIGMGTSKPMIRGMGFNRISVIDNGIKQEGQQWGSDHGLEIDAFGVERVIVRKGPASLLYGSDAMGGTIEILPLPPPFGNQIVGEIALLGKSVNGTIGGTVMLGVKKNGWFTKIRYSEQRFGDYRVPADTVVYLTQRLPIENRRLKNTAGHERSLNLYSRYGKGKYSAYYSVSNVYQKTGFFAAAHGVPDPKSTRDDGDHRNIDMPYSSVNHFKVSTHQKYAWTNVEGSVDLGFQNNHREEWSLFHTHYGTQQPPARYPDKELEFDLNTFSSSVRARTVSLPEWEHTLGWDVQLMQNRIGGYSFLLPAYDRFSTGFFWVGSWRPNRRLFVSGGMRYDLGKLRISPYRDEYLAKYLEEQGYGDVVVESYSWRSYDVKRNFGDISGSLGVVWNLSYGHNLKFNVGRSFRLPGANELASNGIHHGSFRHEQGDPSLGSERGWMADVSYTLEQNGMSMSVSPFMNRFTNYIYLKPTGEWSILPHAGQIYRYTEAEALFAGTEITFSLDFLRCFNYRFAGEYVYTQNLEERMPLPFSPPMNVSNILTYKNHSFTVFVEWQRIFSQNRVSRNEDATPGANLWNMGAIFNVSILGTEMEVTLAAHNILNAKYYNHLSFYRKLEIPEPGRNIQLLIKIPIKNKIK